MLDRLEGVEKRYEELTRLMASPDVATDPELVAKYARERADMEAVVDKYREHKRLEHDIAATEGLLAEEQDQEMRELAREELADLTRRRDQALEAIKLLLLPRDRQDEKDVIMEIRAGTGGDEAGLFAADLFRMYTRFAEIQGWDVEVVDANQSGIGGFKEIVFEIKGRGAYSRLKYESGVHRVQRVPLTEASGRIHTSTATVAVLPEVEEVDVRINPNDLRVDIFHSGGAGGQNVNKVATAVRITHLPTGMVVTCQDERSQLKNKLRAMSVLRAKLYDAEQRKQQSEIIEARRSQVGTGERAEKIRTYNFPQDRVTDHRIGLTLHNLPSILAGNLQELIDAIATADQAEKLKAAGMAA
ncbi:MAG: peptide chain release factor 1 [Chloroflexi bacterium]|nr:peptide chain release factor 1 [Chloroflexota bacterium]